MFRNLLMQVLLLASYIITSAKTDYGSHQLTMYKNKTNGLPIPVLTVSNGAPVEFHDAESSLNSNIIRNRYLIESMSHLNRERISERVVHARGAGAFGYFEVTNDLSHISKAKLFGPVGEQTPVAVRFSVTFAHLGEVDTKQGSRGFAIKFYTEEGNFDMLGNSDVVFPVSDPVDFRSFVHTNFENPVNNLPNLEALWDFVIARPESLHGTLRLFSELGTPASYQNMAGFSIHTYQFVNNEGEYKFARFHVIPDAGLKYLNTSEHAAAASESTYHTRLLYNAIAGGDYPSWTVKLQILSIQDIMNSKHNVFDPTRDLYVEDYPLTEFGRIVLNRNPDNFYKEMEQIAFCPSNLVPGILGAPDKLFEARAFSYRDAHNYRLGANFDNIHVNYPYRSKMATYNRDGVAPVRDNGMDGPNYYPNTFNGPQPYTEAIKSHILSVMQNKTYNFDQVDRFYRQLRDAEKSRVTNIVVLSLRSANIFLQEKAVALLSEVNTELGNNVAEGLANL